MIDRCRGAFPVRMMCQHLGVSPSGYYEWRGRPPSQRARANQQLLRRIRALHEGSEGVLGRRRIQEDLAEEGLPAGVNRVGRLMKNAGLFGILQRRRWRKKTSAPRPSSVLNHLDRNFEASRSNTKWATDITYVRTGEDWLYLCVVIDLYARLVVGWSMSAVQDRQLVLQAVLMALWQRQDRSPVVLHSDRGTQFASDEYQRFLRGHNLTCSMSAVGSCADNALVEGFFGMLKRERVNRRRYPTRAQARADIFDYIERFYNPRMRSKLTRQESQKTTLNQTVRENGT
jgi:putative transposase